MQKNLTLVEIMGLVKAGTVAASFDGDGLVFRDRATGEILVPAETSDVITETLARFDAGEVDAFATLIALPNNERGTFVAKCYEQQLSGKLCVEDWRAVLDAGWNHDYVRMANAAGSKEQLRRWFRSAKFPVLHLPVRFTVYRGGAGVNLVDLGSGYSWTRDPDIAAWFALMHHGNRGDPLVLSREITRRQVLAHITERDEDEIVMTQVVETEIHRDINEWREMADRHAERRKKEDA
jgi:hypothetical protein